LNISKEYRFDKEVTIPFETLGKVLSNPWRNKSSFGFTMNSIDGFALFAAAAILKRQFCYVNKVSS
jgi:hypothetical protein